MEMKTILDGGSIVTGYGEFELSSDGSTVRAFTGSIVSAHEGSFIRTFAGSTVTANAGSVVKAYNGSTVKAYRGAVVIAYRGAVVIAYRGAVVIAYPGSTVHEHEGSTVVKDQNAAPVTTDGYTISGSGIGTHRFTARAEAERYLIWLGYSYSYNGMLDTAYALYHHGAGGYEFDWVTVTFDGGDKVTK